MLEHFWREVLGPRHGWGGLGAGSQVLQGRRQGLLDLIPWVWPRAETGKKVGREITPVGQDRRQGPTNLPTAQLQEPLPRPASEGLRQARSEFSFERFRALLPLLAILAILAILG